MHIWRLPGDANSRLKPRRSWEQCSADHQHKSALVPLRARDRQQCLQKQDYVHTLGGRDVCCQEAAVSVGGQRQGTDELNFTDSRFSLTRKVSFY